LVASMPAAARAAMSHRRQSGEPGVASTTPPERIMPTTIGAMARWIALRQGESLKRSQSSATHHAMTAAGKQIDPSATKAPGSPATFQPIRLAISIHAADPAKRSELMPVNDRYPLEDVLAECRRYVALRRRKVFVEYVMLGGVNDSPADARALAALLDTRAFKVNLIPYNPTGLDNKGSQFEGSSREAIERFNTILNRGGIPATVRLTRGRDIQAACGQLAVERATA